MTYTKGAAAGAWTYGITVPGAEITGGTAGTPFSIGSGALQFDTAGKLLVVHCGGTGDGWRHASGRHHVHDAGLDERRRSIDV